jgi:beta-glucosidase
MTEMKFPVDFIWGAATASYQVEGAFREDGRGESIWDRFCHTPGRVQNGDTGDVACDHYHRYPEDIQIMQGLGLDAYRLSIAWPRLFPQGVGELNRAGLGFYDRLIDGLLAAGIRPYVTLYHWDLPQALQDRGGWANPESVDWFTAYTDAVARHFGDRVKDWMTLNEPWVFCFLANWIGIHAPGNTDFRLAAQTGHHAMLAHKAAVPILRQHSPGAQVGIALSFNPAYPLTDSPEDRLAAQHSDGYANRWFLDILYKGHYSPDLVAYLGEEWLGHLDLGAVANPAPIDFMGVNYYTRQIIRAGQGLPPFNFQVIKRRNALHTAMDWEVVPFALRDFLKRLHADYSPGAIYISENGSAFDDDAPTQGPDGEVVEDPWRVHYLEGHLQAVAEAIAAGVPMKGYFAWSLLDNFEWQEGYAKRFGMVHVDFHTQKRTLKRTALRYKEIIRQQKGG